MMDEVTRAEIDKLHDRVSSLKERVVNLEAQQPHISAALVRIEEGVRGLYGHLSKAIWIVVALLIAAVAKFILSGGLTIPHLTP